MTSGVATSTSWIDRDQNICRAREELQCLTSSQVSLDFGTKRSGTINSYPSEGQCLIDWSLTYEGGLQPVVFFNHKANLLSTLGSRLIGA